MIQPRAAIDSLPSIGSFFLLVGSAPFSPLPPSFSYPSFSFFPQFLLHAAQNLRGGCSFSFPRTRLGVTPFFFPLSLSPLPSARVTSLTPPLPMERAPPGPGFPLGVGPKALLSPATPYPLRDLLALPSWRGGTSSSLCPFGAQIPSSPSEYSGLSPMGTFAVFLPGRLVFRV